MDVRRADLEGSDISSGAIKLSLPGAKTFLFSLALVALFTSLSEIVDYFELPFESLATHLLASGSLTSTGFVASSMASFGYAGVFALMALESASLPIPSEVVLPFAGYLVFKGSMNFVDVVLVSTAAGLIGSMVDYYLAYKLGRPAVVRLFKWFGARPEHLDRAEKWLGANGSWTILVARFIPGLRSAISLPAGILGMELKAFVVMTIIGSFGWSASLTYLGYSAGNLWQTALGSLYSFLAEVGPFVIALASLSYIVYHVVSLKPARTTH